MAEWDYGAEWYHGSPLGDLTRLRPGSAITQNRDAARAFSHRPSIVSSSASGVRHDGKIEAGFLYRVTDRVSPQDVACSQFAGNEDRLEWIIERAVAVALVERTRVRPEELLSESEVEALRRMAQRLKER